MYTLSIRPSPCPVRRGVAVRLAAGCRTGARTLAGVEGQFAAPAEHLNLAGGAPTPFKFPSPSSFLPRAPPHSLSKDASRPVPSRLVPYGPGTLVACRIRRPHGICRAPEPGRRRPPPPHTPISLLRFGGFVRGVPRCNTCGNAPAAPPAVPAAPPASDVFLPASAVFSDPTTVKSL
jgi:hypothetical protein